MLNFPWISENPFSKIPTYLDNLLTDYYLSADWDFSLNESKICECVQLNEPITGIVQDNVVC